MSEHKKLLIKLQEVAKDGHVAMFLLKKTYSKRAEMMREILKVDIEGDAENFFRSALSIKINNLINSENQFKDFFTESAISEDVLVINDIKIIPTLPHIISHIEQHTNLESVRKFNEKTMAKLHSYAIEISLDEDNKIIYFRKYGKGSKLSSKSGFLFGLRNGTFDKIDGDIFKLDKYVDSIYYKNGDKTIMYITNVKNFESIFEFMDVYKQESDRAYEVLKSSGFIVINEELFDEIKEQKRLLKQIALLNHRNKFDNLDFQSIKNLYGKAKNLQFTIKDEKIIISDKKALMDFLDVCERHILADPFEDDIFYRAKSTEKI